MLPYFIMVGIPALLFIGLVWLKTDERKVNRMTIDSFFAIWLALLIFRSETVGIDVLVYKRNFQRYLFYSWSEIFTNVLDGEIEAGFVVITKLLSYVTSNFRWMIIIAALISVIPIWYLFRKEGKVGFLAIAMFITVSPFAMFFSGLRQAMAMAFVVPCYYFCREKKIWHWLFMIFVAFLFHRSALILLFMYPVYHLRLKREYHIAYILPIIGVVYLYKKPIFAFLLRFVGDYADEYAGEFKETGAFAVTLLLAVLLIYAFIIADPDKIDYDTMGLRNLMVLCAVLQVFSGVHTIAMRMNYYYLILIPIAISKIIKNANRKLGDIVSISVICLTLFFTGYFFYHAYTDADILRIYPYVWMFS